MIGFYVELTAKDKFIDIVAQRFDAGIRLGHNVAKDMIAVRISDDLQMCTVASPNYLAQHGTPKTPYDLTEHQCLLHCLPSTGGNMVWEFADPKIKGHIVRIQPQGRFKTNHSKLIPILSDWNMSYEGYHFIILIGDKIRHCSKR